MTKLLYSQSTQSIHPYPRNDDSPVIGLDPDFLVLTRIETSPPNHDPETQSITDSWEVDIDSLEYRQAWTVSDIEPVVPLPDWDGFNAAILGDVPFNQTMGAVMQLTPSVAVSIPSALSLVSTNGVSAFALVFSAFCQVGQVTESQRGIWADLAESHHLPADFVAVIRA